MADKSEIKGNRRKFLEYLKNKRVVIVGPAPTMVDSKQHDIIESYDVVVRLNRALPILEKLKPDIGSRTDILYNCMNPSNECGGTIDIELLQRENIKVLVSPYAPVEG